MATFFVILFLETNVGIRFDIFSKAQKRSFFLRYSQWEIFHFLVYPSFQLKNVTII